MNAKLILKTRDFIKMSRRAYGGKVASYTKWKTVGKFDTLEQAIAASKVTADRVLDDKGPGSKAIYYKGRRVTYYDFIMKKNAHKFCVHGWPRKSRCWGTPTSCHGAGLSPEEKPPFISDIP
jgi:hypothetical protein